MKKRRFWPKHVDGNGIDKRIEGHAFGIAKSLPGHLDGVAFKIFALIEEDYTMKLMSAFGATIGLKVTKTVKYTEPFYDHFKYRHQVDAHNRLQHLPTLLEESVSTRTGKSASSPSSLALSRSTHDLRVLDFATSQPSPKLNVDDS
jgi:hypothetical protein